MASPLKEKADSLLSLRKGERRVTHGEGAGDVVRGDEAGLAPVRRLLGQLEVLVHLLQPRLRHAAHHLQQPPRHAHR